MSPKSRVQSPESRNQNVQSGDLRGENNTATNFPTQHAIRNTQYVPPRTFVIRHSSFVIARAFTLIELMIVIGIMAVVVAMGIPMVYHALHKEGLTKAV